MFDNHPFRIKVDAVIIRADGTRELLGAISSSVMEEEHDNNSLNEQDEKQLS